jgi:hypothetical protein
VIKKLFKLVLFGALAAFAGLIAIQYDGPRNFLKDLGVPL